MYACLYVYTVHYTYAPNEDAINMIVYMCVLGLAVAIINKSFLELINYCDTLFYSCISPTAY